MRLLTKFSRACEQPQTFSAWRFKVKSNNRAIPWNHCHVLIKKLQVRIINRLIFISTCALIITATALAQASNQEPTIGELQKQMEEMRSQMVKMENRIAELEAARGIAT